MMLIGLHLANSCSEGRVVSQAADDVPSCRADTQVFIYEENNFIAIAKLFGPILRLKLGLETGHTLSACINSSHGPDQLCNAATATISERMREESVL